MPNEPPLTGLKVLEFAGLAPGPFAGLILADAGASVLRIDRPLSSSSSPPPTADLLTRHKSSLAINLKDPAGAALLRTLARHADVLIDPYRPGVLESLGLGPDVLCAANPRLVYARLTGFRRDGRFAKMAGHDINYLAVSGVLGLLGRRDHNNNTTSSSPTSPSSSPSSSKATPTPPANLLADFAAGGLTLTLGILLALLVRTHTGHGQVLETNMVDGASYLASFARLARHTPLWDQPRGSNLLDSGCPWYDCYETKDGKWMAVGALEPQFFGELIRRLPGMEGKGGEWEGVFEGSDACCSPVYEFGELEEADQRENEKDGNDKEGKTKEGDQRPAVTLRDTPWLAVKRGEGGDEITRGQGPGVEGKGYVGYSLEPGQGGEERLKEWMGWSRGEQFEVRDGGLVLKDTAKL
ncbi:CoA-transferase family III domain-containing protein [Dichotomopilus funicola]|uniref:CoA-transferase family III domain-containing protein n=1 Tax=Dichotomopilus funicola TaxID=1934379 RepID=A0AAN6VAY6_9PEZI|nr:CoA-transferase family III domain-containing protein [Dichotomopilus funicola]